MWPYPYHCVSFFATTGYVLVMQMRGAHAGRATWQPRSSTRDRKDGDLDDVSKLFDEIDGNAVPELDVKPKEDPKPVDWEAMRVRYCRPSSAFWEVRNLKRLSPPCFP